MHRKRKRLEDRRSILNEQLDAVSYQYNTTLNEMEKPPLKHQMKGLEEELEDVERQLASLEELSDSGSSANEADKPGSERQTEDPKHQSGNGSGATSNMSSTIQSFWDSITEGQGMILGAIIAGICGIIYVLMPILIDTDHNDPTPTHTATAGYASQTFTPTQSAISTASSATPLPTMSNLEPSGLLGSALHENEILQKLAEEQLSHVQNINTLDLTATPNSVYLNRAGYPIQYVAQNRGYQHPVELYVYVGTDAPNDNQLSNDLIALYGPDVFTTYDEFGLANRFRQVNSMYYLVLLLGQSTANP